jgi:hypothetical protein
MGSRLGLQALLETLVGNVYFQPPESLKLSYPCIVYSRSDMDTKFADDIPYAHSKQYQLIVIDKDPDSSIPGKVALLPMCTFDRHYTANNLNHDVFDIYY